MGSNQQTIDLKEEWVMSNKLQEKSRLSRERSTGMGLATAKRFVQEGMDHVFNWTWSDAGKSRAFYFGTVRARNWGNNMKLTQRLHDLGRNVWVLDVTRNLLRKGTLKHYIDELSATELTSDPAIFDQAIKGVLENIRPMIETAPVEQAADAYARMMQGKARFRMVLVTKDRAAQSPSL